MTLRAVSKSKRPPRMVTCTACDGATVRVPVINQNRYGEPMEGIEVRNVPCGVCGSTGKVKRKMTGCPCCNGPKASRCPGCAVALNGGRTVHHCERPTEDEIAFETELQFAPSPGRVHGDAGRNSPAADLGVGERSGQRGQR